MNVKNKYGIKINYDTAVLLMDCEIRENLHTKIAPCSEQEFFNAYAKAHAVKYGKEWELAKPNPCY